MQNVEIDLVSKQGHAKVLFSGALDIHHLHDIADTLNGKFENVQMVEIVFDAITDLDLAFIQYYLSLERYLLKQQKKISKKGKFPETLAELLTNTGFGSLVFQ